MDFQKAITAFLSAMEYQLELLDQEKLTLEEKDELTAEEQDRIDNIEDQIEQIEITVAYVEELKNHG